MGPDQVTNEPAGLQEFIAPELQQEKYESIPQQAGAFAEGVLRGAVPFGLGTLAETALQTGPNQPLISKESIRAREEANPILSQTGEMAGLIGSAFIPGGPEIKAAEKAAEATNTAVNAGVKAINPFSYQSILSGAGEHAAQALGMTGTSKLSKVGSLAVKGAVENALLQSGNEMHKMFVQDPNQTAETALLDIGLGGLFGAGLGGAFGAVSPLWKATDGAKFGQFLEATQRRANGEALPLPTNVEDAIAKTGFNIAPEMRAALSKDPEFQNMYASLIDASTRPGLEMQTHLKNFKQQAEDKVLEALGRTSKDMEGFKPTNEYEMGSQVQDALGKELKSTFEPLQEGFNKIRDRFEKIPLTREDDVMADQIYQAMQKDYGLSPSSPGHKLFADTMAELPNIKNLEDLRKYQSIVYNKASGNPELYHASKTINGILRDFETNALERHALAYDALHKGEGLLMKLQTLRSAYKTSSEMIEELNDRLRVGKYGGPDTFVSALKDMKPEEVLRRLSRPNDAGLIDLMQKEFPGVTDMIRQHHLNNLLETGQRGLKEGQAIRPQFVAKAVNDMSPQMQEFALPPGAADKIRAVKTLLDIESQIGRNTSNTAKTLWSKIGGTPMAIMALLTGHNPGSAFLLGHAGTWLMKDAPDAMKLAFMKFLGTEGPVEPAAFKTLVDFAHSSLKGESVLNKSVKAMFKSGSEVLPRNMLPTPKETEKLDKKMKDMAFDNSSLMNTGGSMGYYAPEHGQALSEVATRVSQYLNQQRPPEDKPGILDEPREPSQIEKNQYDRTMTIAQQPLSVLHHAKEGTITPQDIGTLKALYPSLYNRMSQKIMSELTDHKSSDGKIPYKTRMGLSMFLMQPLDSSMTPQSYQMSQQAHAIQGQQTAAKEQGIKNTKSSLTKMSGMYETASQGAAARRTKT